VTTTIFIFQTWILYSYLEK